MISFSMRSIPAAVALSLAALCTAPLVYAQSLGAGLDAGASAGVGAGGSGSAGANVGASGSVGGSASSGSASGGVGVEADTGVTMGASSSAVEDTVRGTAETAKKAARAFKQRAQRAVDGAGSNASGMLQADVQGTVMAR